MRLSFDGFEIDVDSGQLFRAGREIPLERRAFDMLCYLAAHPGRVITKEELLSEVWRAQTLSDGVLSNAAAKLRNALGQAANAREPIETIRGRGYRWHAVQRPHADSTPSASAQSVKPPVDPFVGRASVLAVLERALDQTKQGQAQLVMLVGEVGIGKTRTLEELVKRAHARGLGVWEGSCYDGAGAPAYWPWVEILRAAHADLSRATFRRYLPADSWAMPLLVPELVGVEQASGVDMDAQATRFRLFDEVSRFVAAASAEAPRLLVIDDAHWADEGTLALLAHVIRTLKKRPVMLAVTLRDHTPEADARLATLQRLRKQATYLSLSGLSLDEVEELVVAFEGQGSIDAQLTQALHQRTHGNPFFIRQFLALLAQRGHPLRGEDLALPAAVRDILHQRIDALGSQGRSALQTAAAVGAEFDAGLLAQVLGLPLADVLAALDPALRNGMVIGQPSPHRFAFAHALLRDTIYDALGLVERGALHARLGHVLAQRPAVADPRTLGEIARHFLLAVPPELDACVRHCRRAANALRNALGVETAAELLARASDKLASEGGDPRVRCELLLELGLDRHHAGDLSSAWRALKEAAELAEQIGAGELVARCACRVASWLEVGGTDEEGARRLVARALDMIGDGNPDLRAALLARRAHICLELPAHERAALLAEAEALAAQRKTPEILLEVAICRVNQRDPARIDDARSAVASYRALAQQHASVLTAPQRASYDFSAEVSDYLSSLAACELDAADSVIERCRRLAEASQLMTVRRATEAMRMGRALGDGRLDDLETILGEMGQSSAGGDVFALIRQYYMARLVEARGGLASLAGLVDEIPKHYNEMRPYQITNGALMRARVSAKLGAVDQARRLLSSVPSEYLARLPVHHGDLGVLCFLAETYESLGDRTGALALYPQLLSYAALNAVGPLLDYCGSVEHYLGVLAQLLGRVAEAARHFERAERINRRLRMPVQVALSASRRCAALGLMQT